MHRFGFIKSQDAFVPRFLDRCMWITHVILHTLTYASVFPPS